MTAIIIIIIIISLVIRSPSRDIVEIIGTLTITGGSDNVTRFFSDLTTLIGYGTNRMTIATISTAVFPKGISTIAPNASYPRVQLKFLDTCVKVVLFVANTRVMN